MLRWVLREAYAIASREGTGPDPVRGAPMALRVTLRIACQRSARIRPYHWTSILTTDPQGSSPKPCSRQSRNSTFTGELQVAKVHDLVPESSSPSPHTLYQLCVWVNPASSVDLVLDIDASTVGLGIRDIRADCHPVDPVPLG